MKNPDQVSDVADIVIGELYPHEGEIIQNISKADLHATLIVFYHALLAELRNKR